jgi:flagellin-like hook-associated protein FlgL
MTMPAASSNAAPVSAAVNPTVSNAATSAVAAPTAATTQVALSPAATSASAAANATTAVNGVNNAAPAQTQEAPNNVIKTGPSQSNRPLQESYVDKVNTKHISQQQADSTLKQINPNQKEELLSRSIERLSTEISKNQKQISNTVNAYSMIQVANDSLDEIQGGLKELQRLIQGTSSEPKEDQTDEDFLAQTDDNQAQALDIVAGIQDLFESTKYGGDPLLTQNTNQTFASHNETEYGVTVTTHNVDTKFERAGLYEIDLNSPESIRTSLSSINGSMDVVRDIRSQYSAQETDFNTKMKKLFSTQEQLDSMHDRITNTDFAIQVAEKAQEEMVNNARGSVLAQANADSGRALNLLTN